MLRRFFVLPLAATATALAILAASAFAAQDINIVPGSGSQDQVFTLAGTGLPPGLALDINFVSPEGTVYTLGDKVVIVDEDGDFEFDIVPAIDFKGSSAGIWKAQVCASGTDNCANGVFEIKL